MHIWCFDTLVRMKTRVDELTWTTQNHSNKKFLCYHYNELKQYYYSNNSKQTIDFRLLLHLQIVKSDTNSVKRVFSSHWWSKMKIEADKKNEKEKSSHNISKYVQLFENVFNKQFNGKKFSESWILSHSFAINKFSNVCL